MQKSEHRGKTVAHGVKLVLPSRLVFIFKRNCPDSCLNCDLNRLRRRSLFQEQHFRGQKGAVHASWLEMVRLSLTAVAGLETRRFEETQPTQASREIYKFQPKVHTVTQSVSARISFLRFAQHNFPHFILICKTCVGTCHQYLNLFKASALKDRGHL